MNIQPNSKEYPTFKLTAFRINKRLIRYLRFVWMFGYVER